MGTTVWAPPCGHHRMGTTVWAPHYNHHRMGTTVWAPPCGHHRMGTIQRDQCDHHPAWGNIQFGHHPMGRSSNRHHRQGRGCDRGEQLIDARANGLNKSASGAPRLLRCTVPRGRFMGEGAGGRAHRRTGWRGCKLPAWACDRGRGGSTATCMYVWWGGRCGVEG